MRVRKTRQKVRFLVDECSSAHRVINQLRSFGYDVATAVDRAGSSDDDVLQRGLREKRVLITEDRDFGVLVFRDHAACFGCIFLSGWQGKLGWIVTHLTHHVTMIGFDAVGAFVTLRVDTTGKKVSVKRRVLNVE